MHTPKPVITTATALAELLNDIVAVLEQEQLALKNSTTEQVETVTTRKQAVLQKFNQVHPTLVHRVTDSSRNTNESVEIAHIRGLITICQRYNRENAALVAHGLQMCRYSINFLHGTLQMQSVERYNLSGQTVSGMSTRVIGTA